MSEAVTPPVEGQPPVVETPPSTLPSDNPAVDFAGFDMTDDMKAKFKDGKLNGRFGSMNEVLEKLKEAEDFKAQTIREQKAGDVVDKEAVANQEVAATQSSIIKGMLPSFLANGMALSPEMEAQAVAAKIDIRDLKIGAMELRDAISSAHAVVGGKENYDNMIAWGKDVMTPAQMAAFDKDVTGAFSEYAIKGLNADFQKVVGEGTYTPRIEGQPHFKGIKPYGSRKELYADKDVAEMAKRRGDMQPWTDYQAKLKATPREILGY